MNANINALQRLGLISSNNNPSQNVPSQAPAKENTNSQLSKNIGISQDTQKGATGNPFSGLRSQLQNLASRQKVSFLKDTNNVSQQGTQQQANNNKESVSSTSVDNKLMSLFGLGSNPIVPANVSQGNMMRNMDSSFDISQIPKQADDPYSMQLEPTLSYNSYPPKNEIVSQKPVNKPDNDFIDEDNLEEYAHLFDDTETSFGFKTRTQKQENLREEQPMYRQNNTISNTFPSQFQDGGILHTQKKVKQNHEFPSDSTKYTINITATKSSPATKANFTQLSKREVITVEDSQVQTLKVEKSEVQRKIGTASPLFKLKQQNLSKNQKIVNLGTNDAWKRALVHLRIDLPEQMMGLSANESIGVSLNELNFCTVSQIKGNMCVSLKAPNLLVAIKSFEIHKDTVTMMLMDLTGEIQASIVKSVVSDDINNVIYMTSQKDISQARDYQHGDRVFLKTGTILWLKNVTIFSPGDDTFYLTISQNNIENVFYEKN